MIPIRENFHVSKPSQKMAKLAYDLWLERGVRGESTRKNLLRALREGRRRASVVLFQAPKRRVDCDITSSTFALTRNAD